MLEKFLHQTPFVKFAIPLILGIILKITFPEISTDLTLPFLFLLICIILFQIFKLNSHFRLNRIWSFLIFLAILMVGSQLAQIKQDKVYKFENKEYNFIATIIESPVEKENSIKALLKINAYKDSNLWINPETKLLTYFQKDSTLSKLNLGDKIFIKAYINGIKHSGNPYAFNYKEYLTYKEIYYQTYIKADKFIKLDSNCGSKLILTTHKLRQTLLEIYQNNSIKGDEFAVLSALTLGYKKDLTPELKESFSTSGAMHVLAVSGLHVGIIFIILSKLLFFLERKKYGKVIKSIILILVLIFYAMLTGLSNSVIRATIMFSFICIGKTFTRQINIYNTLSASAFIMLLYNPYSIMDVGFQLSYLAVISIVFFQPKIYSLYTPKHKLSDYTWQLISVAIAAQIGTFPITIHYFGQFPVFFILSNILIIPVVSVLIYGAIILFIFSFSPSISSLLAKGLQQITFILNKNVEIIQNLPFSKLDSILIDKFEIILLTCAILFLSFFIISKKFKFFRYVIVILIISISYNIYVPITNSKKSLFVVFNIPKKTAINIINQNYSVLYTNLDYMNESKNIEYNIEPLWKNLGIKEIINNKINPDEKIFQTYYIKGKRILNISNWKLHNYIPKSKLSIDYIVLSANVNLKIENLNDYFQFQTLIFDSSNSIYKITKWEKECQENNIKYHSVIDKGAFIQYL